MNARETKRRLIEKKEQALLIKYTTTAGETVLMPKPDKGEPMEAVEILEWAKMVGTCIANGEVMDISKKYFLEFESLFSYKVNET